MLEWLDEVIADEYIKKGRIVPFNPLIKDAEPDEEAMQYAVDDATNQFRGLLFDNVRGATKEMVDGLLSEMDAEFGTEFKDIQFGFEDYDDLLEIILDTEEDEEQVSESTIPEIEE